MVIKGEGNEMNTNKQKVTIPTEVGITFDTPVSVGEGTHLYHVVIENIEYEDYPDFCNAHITYAEVDDPETGERRELSGQEIEDLDPAYVQEYIWDYIF